METKGPNMKQENMKSIAKAAKIIGLLYLLIMVFVQPVFADARTDSTLRIKEEDGSPSKTPHTLKVTNGTLTDNGDGTVSLDTGGGASGDSVTVNTTDTDTTANIKDTTTVTWAVVDGGAGGPDDVQATAVDVTCTNCLTNTEVASSDLATNVADADYGDITVSSGAWTIEDSVTVTGWVLGTSSATTLTAGTVNIDLLDGVGAVDMDYGSVDITDHTFTTDGTGTAEIVLPAGSIDGTEILDGTIGTADISGSAGITAAQTALTAGAYLTLSTNDLAVDAEAVTFNICWNYPASPVATDDNKSVWMNDTGKTLTILRLKCKSDQTVTMMPQVDDGSPADMDSVDLVCVSTPDTDTSLDGDATVADGDGIDIDTASVSGTPTWCTVCMTGTLSD